MAGIFARYIWLNRSYFYAICFAAMLVYDGLTSRWGMGFASFLINFSNLVLLSLWRSSFYGTSAGRTRCRDRLTRLACFATACWRRCSAPPWARWGSVDVERATFIPQLATGLANSSQPPWLILPFILTLTLPSAFGRFRLRQLLPAIALVLSIVLGVAVGGAGSITFPLPALIWCAIRYPLPLTCLLTFITGISEILLVANSLIHLSPDSRMQAVAAVFDASGDRCDADKPRYRRFQR
ncbi:diguanylate cyclase [Klebsiella oxytoca]|nr:diguanylate cyclase [Klebsiella oxytoca]